MSTAVLALVTLVWAFATVLSTAIFALVTLEWAFDVVSGKRATPSAAVLALVTVGRSRFESLALKM